MIHSKHILSHCIRCETDMVLCATCGNNSCNATYGIINGERCRDCPEAYEHQAAHHKDANSVRFAQDKR